MIESPIYLWAYIFFDKSKNSVFEHENLILRISIFAGIFYRLFFNLNSFGTIINIVFGLRALLGKIEDNIFYLAIFLILNLCENLNMILQMETFVQLLGVGFYISPIIALCLMIKFRSY